MRYFSIVVIFLFQAAYHTLNAQSDSLKQTYPTKSLHQVDTVYINTSQVLPPKSFLERYEIEVIFTLPDSLNARLREPSDSMALKQKIIL